MSRPHDPASDPPSQSPSQTTSPSPTPPAPDADPEVLDDGQEEVFSRRAVEAGHVADPKALDPEDLARAPKSPGPIPGA